MAYDITKLQVASLDYSYIVNSLTTFLESQPELNSIDFRNKASAANMIINMLATATAYNGIYTQLGLKESFISTASILESIVGIASNHSILLPISQSAKAIGTTNLNMLAYTPFKATAIDGSSLFFYNVEPVTASAEGSTVEIYAGTSVITFTDWDFDSQSTIIPYTIDPRTISLYEIPDITDVDTKIKWTKVTKSSKTQLDNQTIFTVTNAANGYLVTTNLANAKTIPTSSSVQIIGIQSVGDLSNNAIINTSYFSSLNSPSGGYSQLSTKVAKAKVLFGNSSEKCVTLEDYRNAIVASGIEGTEDKNLITVTNSNIPGSINIFVENLSEANQSILIEYLSTLSVAGILLNYGEQ